MNCSPEQYQPTTKRRKQNIAFKIQTLFNVQYSIKNTIVIKKLHWENKIDCK